MKYIFTILNLFIFRASENVNTLKHGNERTTFFEKIRFIETNGRGGIRTHDQWLRRPLPYPG